MTEAMVLEIGKRTLILVLQMTLPILTLTLIAGLAISIFQAVTQVHEFTLTFIPKVFAAVLAMLLFGPWMLNNLLNFTSRIFIDLPNYIK
ncbi:MAG TPA: flagellar biosynthesis protein FliQ [Actinobacteria bacterium]|nr:flagellar biosynthesis protein FliQ [Actinomycetota bacterium]